MTDLTRLSDGGKLAGPPGSCMTRTEPLLILDYRCYALMEPKKGEGGGQKILPPQMVEAVDVVGFRWCY